MSFASTLFNRLGQASTWAGVSGACGLAIGAGVVPASDKPIVAIVGGCAAALSVVITEGWQKAAFTGDAVTALEQRVAYLENAPTAPVPLAPKPASPPAPPSA